MKKNQINRSLNILIKVAILCLLFWAIYNKVLVNNKWLETKDAFYANLQQFSYILLLWVILLMIVNWGLEAFKWQTLIRKIEKINFFVAYKAILCGVTLAVFTPNRIGEYGGRVFYLQKANKIEAVAITLIGSFSQLIANLLIGIIGLIIYLKLYQDLDAFMFNSIVFFLTLLASFLLTAYFNISFVTYFFERIKFLKKIATYVKSYYLYSFKELAFIFGLSFIRYLVFTAQYLILLYLFGVPISIFEGFVIINMIFLVQTIIPSIALIEIGIRGNIALEFIGAFSLNTLGILAATFSLWLINLIVPAILGSLLILKLNFLNNKK